MATQYATHYNTYNNFKNNTNSKKYTTIFKIYILYHKNYSITYPICFWESWELLNFLFNSFV